jgi:hypothetical protein
MSFQNAVVDKLARKATQAATHRAAQIIDPAAALLLMPPAALKGPPKIAQGETLGWR